MNKDELVELVEQLRKASDSYYNTGVTVLTDEEYDLKVAELRKLDPENEFLKTVGAPPLSGQIIKHSIPMGSQEKLQGKDEYDRWTKMILEMSDKFPIDFPAFVMQLKLDGSSLAINYENGKLVSAATRGDGYKGEDITQNVLKMQNVAKKLPIPFTGSLRGEMMLNISTFKEIFLPKGYMNPRNTVSGLSRDRKGGDLQKHFKVIYYDLECEQSFTYETERLDYIKNVMQLEVVSSSKYETAEEVFKAYQALEANRAKLDIEIDGVIIRANLREVQAKLGTSSDLRPKGQRCLKFAPMGATTKLLSVDLSIGHTGAIIPTATLAPVSIGGVTVTHALLNNFNEIERLGVAINDTVMVIRTGDIIPKIVKVVEQATDRVLIPVPAVCPYCKSALVRDRRSDLGALVLGGAHLYCRNDACDGQNFRKLKNWITKREIKYLGDDLLLNLYNNHNIKQPQDLYKLTEDYLAKIVRSSGSVVGSLSKQIMSELEKSKTCPLADFIGSLPIKFMGRRMAEIMVDLGINTLEKFQNVTVEQLIALRGFSIDGSKAPTIVEGIRKIKPMIEALLLAGIKVEEGVVKEVISGGKLTGYACCFTGVRPTTSEREKFTSLGGVVKDSVSKNSTHLVVRDPMTNSNKAQKARALGTKVVSYEEFQSWLS